MSEEFVLKRFGDLVPRDLVPGDLVVGLNGKLTEIVEVYDEHIPETMHEIHWKKNESEAFQKFLQSLDEGSMNE